MAWRAALAWLVLSAVVVGGAVLVARHGRRDDVERAMAPYRRAVAAYRCSDSHPVRVRLWPGRAPGEVTEDFGHASGAGTGLEQLSGVTAPELVVYHPAWAEARPAVVVCPGGGYALLASDIEGSEIASWLNSIGYLAVVLHYRVPNRRDGALQDLQRSVSLVRAKARELRIDAGRIGVLGFSAGAHLTARLIARGTARSYAPVDAADRASCRPDLAMMVYPAFLSGEDGQSVAAEVRPGKGAPPVFLAQTRDDPFLCASAYATALDGARVPHRLVMYRDGGHGYGVRAGALRPVHQWADEAARFAGGYWRRPRASGLSASGKVTCQLRI